MESYDYEGHDEGAQTLQKAYQGSEEANVERSFGLGKPDIFAIRLHRLDALCLSSLNGFDFAIFLWFYHHVACSELCDVCPREL